VDGGGSLRCALMGDRLAGLGMKNHWNGIIIYGAIRDSAGIGSLPFGVKALDTVPITKVTTTEWQENIPVHFAGVFFTPGHFVYSDEDGTIVSSAELNL
jgi:regulator of ribonuclease activity A